ncbi:MAG: hypothetical protein IPG45_02205 [Deltaproteobacteria bacterium]|nr:hypothetical protein [Deltaproteobacteria bacterium]
MIRNIWPKIAFLDLGPGLVGGAISQVGATTTAWRERSEAPAAVDLRVAEGRRRILSREGVDALAGPLQEGVPFGGARAHRRGHRGLGVQAADLDAGARGPIRLHLHVALLVGDHFAAHLDRGHDQVAFTIELGRLGLARHEDVPFAHGSSEDAAERRVVHDQARRHLVRIKHVRFARDLDLVDVRPEQVLVITQQGLAQAIAGQHLIDQGLRDLGFAPLGFDLGAARGGAPQIQGEAPQ